VSENGISRAEMGQLAEARSKTYGLLASLCTELPTPELTQAIMSGHIFDTFSPLADAETVSRDLIDG
jgi:hypothetical protein